MPRDKVLKGFISSDSVKIAKLTIFRDFLTRAASDYNLVPGTGPVFPVPCLFAFKIY